MGRIRSAVVINNMAQRSRGRYVLCLALLQPCTDLPWSVALWLTRRLGLYDVSCQNLLRGDRVLILVPSNCFLRLLQPLDLSSVPVRRSTACSNGCHFLFLAYYLVSLLPYTLWFAFVWPLRFSWLYVFSLYKEDYLHSLNVRPFDYTAFVVSGKAGPT